MKTNIKYLIDFIREKRILVVLYFVTIGFFLVVGYLDHVENLGKLIYAMILSTAIWIFALFLSFYQYRKKRIILQQKLLFFQQEWEQNPDFFLDLAQQSWSALEEDYQNLLSVLQEKNQILVKQIEKKESERNDYFLLWTHQIKTPIAALRLLLDQREDSMNLKQELFKIEQYVDMMLQYERLSDISHDLLLKEADLSTLIKKAVKKFGIIFIQKGIRMELDEIEVKFVTDEKWFCFVLEQIVSNSLKYSDSGTIHIYLSENMEQTCTLCIEDQGSGIREEDLPRIYERGFTGHNGRGSAKSTGVGLYMCKQILEKLGVEIQTTSREQEGTKTYLKLTKM